MGTTTLLELDTALMKSVGPFRRHPVTTAINADNLIVSTHLQNYRSSADYFNNWWLFLEDQANADISRQISDDDGTSTLTVRGVALSDDSANLANFRISPYSWEQRTDAIIEAIDEIYPSLHRNLDLSLLVTGNLLPNGHFEEQATSGTPDRYTFNNASGTKTTAAANIRGGSTSIKVTASGANGYITIRSIEYPRLLDLSGQTVTVKVWANPQDADDVDLTLTASQADGTSQTFTSTTTAPAGKWTLLVLENQSLNDDLVQLDVQFRVHTSGKFAYFDDARLFGKNAAEYLLPTEFDSGSVAEVWIQQGGGFAITDTDASDMLQPRNWQKINGWQIIQKEDVAAGLIDNFLRLPALFTERRRIRLIGTAPFETLVSTTSSGTITLDGRRVNLLVALAKYKLFTTVPDLPAADDTSRFDALAAKALFDYRRLSHLAMPQKSRSMNLRAIGSGV